jgi:hypothetical protein
LHKLSKFNDLFQKRKEIKQMKGVVRLAIVVATLLVVGNTAFAGTCAQKLCYDVTFQFDGGYANCIADFCLNEDGTGSSCLYNGESLCDGCITLGLFGGGPGWYNYDGDPNFGGKPMWTTWICVDCIGGGTFFQPIGEGYLLTGVSSDTAGTSRSTITGKRITCP